MVTFTKGSKVEAGTITNTFDVTAENSDYFIAEFARAGKYTVYAGVINESDKTLAGAQLISGEKGNFDTITVSGLSTDPELYYRADLLGDEDESWKTDGKVIGTISISPDNIANEYTVKFGKSDTKATEEDLKN